MSNGDEAHNSLNALVKLGSEAKRCIKALTDQGYDAAGIATLVRSIRRQLDDVTAAPAALDTLASELDERRSLEVARFWSTFAETCKAKNWRLQGTTNRRLLECGIFVELRADTVEIEEMALTLPPSADQIRDAVELQIADIRSWIDRHDMFLRLLEQAYESVPGTQERSLEAVYRAALFEFQRPSFWKAPTSDRFAILSRPTFRACLSSVIANGSKTPHGRSLRFGTSNHSKESWELYSPGEDRVVQVGRLTLEYTGT